MAEQELARKSGGSMDAKIQSISLVVKDKAKALQFYVERVGFEKKTDVTNNGYRYVTVGPMGQDLELALWQIGSPDPKGWSKNWKAGGSPPINLTVSDCKKMVSELGAKGVDFRQEAEENPYSISAVFADPDGNLFQINEFRRKGKR